MNEKSNFPESSRTYSNNDIVWDKLYRLLIPLVRYWVYSSDVRWWCGQEEDIIADIVQEAMTYTFAYSLEYSLWAKEQEVALYNALKRISTIIAYRQYRDLRRQDYLFMCTQLLGSVSQGYFISHKQIDSTETELENAPQEWDFIQLVPTSTRPYKTPPHLVYKHIWEMVEEQGDIEEINRSQKLKPVSMDAELDTIGDDPELAALAERLDATVPPAAVNPAFREALQDKLLDILAKHNASKAERLNAIVSSARPDAIVSSAAKRHGEAIQHMLREVKTLREPPLAHNRLKLFRQHMEAHRILVREISSADEVSPG